MKLIMETHDLLDMVVSSSSIASAKSTIPVLADLLIRSADNGDVEIHATDLQVGIITKGVALSSSAGEVRINAKKLLSILKLFPLDSQVHLEKTSGGKVSLKCNSSSMSILSDGCDEFPDVKILAEGCKVVIPASRLLDMLDSVSKSMASDITRLFMCGVLFSMKDGFLSLVSTDGHRLSKSFTSVESSECFKTTVPSRAVSILRKALASEPGDIEIVFSGGKVMFLFGSSAYSTKVIGSAFPDYEVIIPLDGISIEVNRKDLGIALRRAIVVTAELNNDVKFIFDAANLKLSIQTTGNDDNFLEDMPYRGEIKDIEIGFNAKYMLELLNSFSSETVSMTFSDEISPVRVDGESDVNLVYVIMPLRV